MIKTNIENIEAEKQNIDSTAQLEKEILSNTKEDIGFTTKLKLLNKQIFELQEKKNWAKSSDKQWIQNEINSIYREKNRIIRFHKLWSEKLNWIEWLEKDDIDSIDAKKLLKIWNEKKNFLSSTFAYKETKDKDWNITEEALSSPENINEWDTISIDFWKNQWAFRKIWAWDILPAKVQVVKIIDEKWNARIGKRAVSGSKVWYYDERWYIPVFNNYKLYIPTGSELKSDEYKNIWVKSSILTDKKQLKELEWSEKTAKINYIHVIEENEKLSRISDIVVEIGNDLNFKWSYKNKLQAIIDKAKEYKEQWWKYSDEELQLVINRLTRTIEIMWNHDFNFDWDKYKASIAISESWWMYNNRNDWLWKIRWIEPGKWAFGKYQFIWNTLKWFWIELWNPPEEEKVQAWLQNPALQEEIMDKYMLNILEKNILSNPTIMSKIEKWKNKIEYYLALSHIWWPWALADEDRTDWMNTPVQRYAREVADRCFN